MRPIIGITVNCTERLDATIHKGLALSDQTIQYVADDYVKAVERAGGTPVLIPITLTIESIVPMLSVLDGIIFTGGSDIDPHYYGEEPSEHLGETKPRRDAHEIALLKKIIQDTKLPYLGICRGAQLLNVACGGTLYQDIASARPEAEEHSYFGRSPKHVSTHNVSIDPHSTLHRMVSQHELAVNSFHHQAIHTIGEGLIASAAASDGTIEAIEMQGKRMVLAVQWHPEMMAEADQHAAVIFQHFVDHCRSNKNE